MTVASKPPIKRNTSTGITTAISASDCPRLRRIRRSCLISVALWLQPDIRHGGGAHRSQRGKETGLEGVGVVDRDADEVAGSVAHVPARRRVGDRSHGGSVEGVSVGVAVVHGQGAV